MSRNINCVDHMGRIGVYIKNLALRCYVCNSEARVKVFPIISSFSNEIFSWPLEQHIASQSQSVFQLAANHAHLNTQFKNFSFKAVLILFLYY